MENRKGIMMEIKVSLENGAYMPEKAHSWDAGFDLKTPKSVNLPALGNVTIDTGVHIEIPKGYVRMLKSKSGLNVKNSILSEGVIDAGYSGSIVAKLYNNSDTMKIFNVGDKITQLVILPIPEVELVKVDEIIGGDRGNNGFGSTGK